MESAKRRLILIVCLLTILIFPRLARAEEIASEHEYKPLDLVLVVDGSGSMLDSDPDRTALAAGRMLTNMMPAADSRVAIISFNTKPTTHTKNSSGSGTIVSLDSYSNVESIRDAIAEVRYDGDTGIGNALLSATDLLQQESSDDHQRAIILFTDGVNDFGQDAIGLSQCDENEAKALQWAKKNGCVIYCVGYDYALPSGGSSMGENGEGLAKLKNIAETTGGTFKAISNISEMERLLIEFMADVCDLVYKTVATIPGDGGEHSAPIDVSPSVVEIDIRIAGGSENAIANGEVRLYDPDGNVVELKNSGNVRYDVDATSASIKVVMPKPGEWRIVVKGITGDDIHVGLLEHFKMNLSSKIVFPKGNPAGVAYARDVLGVEAWLTYDGEDLQDDDVYEAVTSATATFVSRANMDDQKVVDLTLDGRVFKGSFTIPADSFYDVTVRLSWDTVYREDTLTVMSSNKPLELVRDIDDVELDNGKTITISNLYQYVFDEENDDITAEISNIGDPDVVDAVVDDNDILVSGHKWSSTLVTVLFSDKQGNTVETTFMAKVNDPVAMALIIASFVLIGLVVIGIVVLILRRTIHIYGTIRVGIIKEVTFSDDGNSEDKELIFEDHFRLNRDSVPGSQSISNKSMGGNNTIPETAGTWEPVESNGVNTSQTTDWGDIQDASYVRDGSEYYGAREWGDAQDDMDSLGDDRREDSREFVDDTVKKKDRAAEWGDFGRDESEGGNHNAADLNHESPEEREPVNKPTPEELEDERRDLEFERGGLDISMSVAKKNPNLFDVLETFCETYREHMTLVDRVSRRADLTTNCVTTRLREFSQFRIKGTHFGRGGISIRIPKKTSIVLLYPKPVKEKIALRGQTVMKFEVRPKGAPTGMHVEIEYEPLKS